MFFCVRVIILGNLKKDKYYMNNKIIDPEISYAMPHKHLAQFGMVWVAIMVLTLFSASKTINIFGAEFVVAIIAYPLTYIFSDIFTEIYGYRVSRKIVWTGFGSLILVATLGYIYTLIPASPNFTDQASFNLIFQAAPGLVACFIAGFFAGDLINSFVLAKMKVALFGKYEELRYVVSTFFGQLADNTIAFTGVYVILSGFYPLVIIPTLIISSVIFCTLVEIIMLPITKRVISWIKEKEGIDTYDHGTNFNPFKLG